jgi:hypothetical protein
MTFFLWKISFISKFDSIEPRIALQVLRRSFIDSKLKPLKFIIIKKWHFSGADHKLKTFEAQKKWMLLDG